MDTQISTSVCTKAKQSGNGSQQGGGAAASVGHRYGNTEEEYRVLILGCKEQGRKHQGPLDHATGKGWVKQRDG